MRTDKQLFQIFSNFPEWLFELAELPFPGHCVLRPFAVKSLERDADGVVIPDDPLQPITVVEFQCQRDDRIYTVANFRRLVGTTISTQGKTGD